MLGTDDLFDYLEKYHIELDPRFNDILGRYIPLICITKYILHFLLSLKLSTYKVFVRSVYALQFSSQEEHAQLVKYLFLYSNKDLINIIVF